MQQIASYTPLEPHTNKLTAMQRDARDPNQPNGGGEFMLGFDDVLDAVNPLHHVPGVSSLYQQSTGDAISPILSIASGALFGGPIGAAISAANIAFEAISGDSVIGHIANLFTDDIATTTVASASKAYATAGGLAEK